MRYRYREEHEMKDSGVEWLGKIPKDWEIKRNRHIFDFRRREVNEYEDTTVLSLTTSGVKIKEDLSFGKSTESYIGHQLVYPGDIVFTPRDFDQTPILSGVSKYYGCISNLYFVLKCKSNISNYFVDYFWWGLKYKVDFFKNFSYGIRYGYNYDQFKDLLFLNPSYIEQEKIANFLDKKTSQFDLIISKKEELIQRLEEAKKSLISEVVTGKVKVVKSDDGYELVKRSSEEMKDSGVEWLGEIPKDWEVLKAARLANIVRGGSPRPAGDPRYFGGNEVPWITVGEVTKDENKYLNSVSSYLTLLGKEQSRFLEKGTLVMSNSGATLGVPKILNISGCINDGSLAFLNVKINKSYFYYLLKSRTEIFRKEMQISGQPNLNTDVVKSLYVLKPLESEQYIIAKYLDTKTVEINKLIDKSKKQIEKIKEAKQSLISEAVIGKIEILD
ncbi:restriction endonuclease subunit S [Terrisporobacter muris]|uniref:Restriction endonuclease subunit S n=1 Tax=Terrisporobacter muris TaxID=2963284 RepID=A0A9X2MDS9_9FIRM|nr:restriction endonuclease subunit S [Terrisporobacter muris]MCR1822066.1 restriction endonuclease subunit S [Terrisporobacter muris]